MVNRSKRKREEEKKRLICLDLADELDKQLGRKREGMLVLHDRSDEAGGPELSRNGEMPQGSVVPNAPTGRQNPSDSARDKGHYPRIFWN